ncbi:hypothetical protein ACM66B_000577 [Microbotryomycetes sp. NB124-2]
MSDRPDRAQSSSRGRGTGSRGRGSSRGRGRGSNSNSGSSNARSDQKRFQAPSDKAPDSIPSGSVSKLKSQLRQTKRLLARDDLTPDVRTTSERRLALLEQELDKAQHSQLERKMVLKYKGVRFFERQKLLRKIKQTKKALDNSPNDDSLKQTLFNTRVDLAYVLRFPKLEKYIALFPEGEYVSFEPPSSTSTTDSSSTKSAERRWTLRQQVRRKMKNQQVGDAVEDGDLGIDDQVDHEAGESEDEAQAGVEQVAANVAGKAKRARSADGEVASKDDGRPAKKERKQPVEQAKVQKQSMLPVKAEQKAAARENEQASGELSRKDKKRLKDARRREAKQQAAAAAAAGGGGSEAKEDAVESAAATNTTTGLAAEDDFFA